MASITAQPIPNMSWHAPWLAPYRAWGEPAAKDMAKGLPTSAALNAIIDAGLCGVSPVRFATQVQPASAAAYESSIWQTKIVPTRDNLHDFFNGLVWLRFPKIKTQLNALQAAAIAAEGVTPHRSRLRDALTLFDENAAFVVDTHTAADGRLLDTLHALKAKAWHDAFVLQRQAWAQFGVVVFGHALLEKLVIPRKAMTAHLFFPPSASPMAWGDLTDVANGQDLQKWGVLDATLAAQLSADQLAAKPFAPLPILGVPGWCAENADPSFYDDAAVFRPPAAGALVKK